MPVTVVRLALVEVVERPLSLRSGGHVVHLGRGPEHLLVEVVDLAVLDLEVAPERAAQPAGLRAVVLLRGMEHLREDQALIGRQGPLAHLDVRAGRDVDATDRSVRLEPGRGRRRGQPAGVGLERREEAFDPVALAPAVLPGRRPRAELLAVVAHHPDPVAVLGRVVAQVVDDLLDVAEGDAIAKALLAAEDAQELTLVIGRVRPPQALLGDRRGAEVCVVEDRPLIAGRDQRGRQVRLPDAFGEPCSGRTSPERRLELASHPAQLADAIAFGERRKDRLVVAPAEDLHLSAIDEPPKLGDEARSLGAQPVEQRTRVVERQADVRMALERVDHRLIGLLEDLRDDPAEVADRLVVVDGQCKRDAGCHRPPTRPRSRASPHPPR